MQNITTESIKYASHIQKGLFPKKRHFRKLTTDFGIIWQPHSIVSGDFYWLSQKDNCFYLSVGDCTGHGIPASLLTVMGISLLNYLLLSKNYNTTGEYLNELDKKWIETFQSDDEYLHFNNDWLELSFVKIDKVKMTLEFSAAKSHIMIVREGSIINFKGNRFPIGGWQIEKERQFSSQQFQLQKNDEIYLFSDGIIDQFGGENDKRFGYKNLRHILGLPIKSVNDKIRFLHETISEWTSTSQQTDDITVVGIKV